MEKIEEANSSDLNDRETTERNKKSSDRQEIVEMDDFVPKKTLSPQNISMSTISSKQKQLTQKEITPLVKAVSPTNMAFLEYDQVQTLDKPIHHPSMASMKTKMIRKSTEVQIVHVDNTTKGVMKELASFLDQKPTRKSMTRVASAAGQ